LSEAEIIKIIEELDGIKFIENFICNTKSEDLKTVMNLYLKIYEKSPEFFKKRFLKLDNSEIFKQFQKINRKKDDMKNYLILQNFIIQNLTNDDILSNKIQIKRIFVIYKIFI